MICFLDDFLSCFFIFIKVKKNQKKYDFSHIKFWLLCASIFIGCLLRGVKLPYESILIKMDYGVVPKINVILLQKGALNRFKSYYTML